MASAGCAARWRRRATRPAGWSLATAGAVPRDCTVLIAASPRTTFLPAESLALHPLSARRRRAAAAARPRLRAGAGAGPAAATLRADAPAQVVVDPLSHYATDAEMVAVTGYEPSPITRNLSMSFFPGARP